MEHLLDRRAEGPPRPAVEGAFRGGEGRFSGADSLDGRPILVRFLWSRIDEPCPRWEQAFSADGGGGWETNWIMDFEPMTGREGEPG